MKIKYKELKIEDYRSIIVLLFFFAISSCSYRTFYPVQVDFELNKVTAIDIEETTLTNGDEIYVLYSMASIDQNGDLFDNKKKSYGPQNFTHSGDNKSGYLPLSIKVPPKGKLVFSFQLIEDDDYTAYSNVLDDAKNIVEIADFASKFDNRDKFLAARTARSLRMVSRGLNVVGIAITVIDIIDENDELMAFCTVLEENDIQNLSKSGRQLRDSYTNVGSNWGNRFEYKIDYSLFASIIPGKIEKERIKSKAPNVIVSVSPYIVDPDLNDFWSSSPDRLLVKSGESSYDWSDGLYNKKLSASLSFGVMPAFRIGSNAIGRFYLQGNYSRIPYLLNFQNNKYLFDGSYFNYNNSTNSADFTVKDFELDMTNYGASALFKIIFKNFIFDIGGGISIQRAKTKFVNLKFGNPAVTLKYNENTNVLNSSRTPFALAKIGYGKVINGKGVQFTLGINAFNPNLEFNENFKVFQNLGIGQPQLVPITNNKFRILYNFGLDFMF